jgi:CPA1 family monovalent cation:H+ antiporter
MIESAELCISLLAIVAAIALLARALKVPGPILLMVGGLLLALVPGLPHLRLDPGFALMLFLPPLVYAAAVQTSWPDFRANLRPIGLLAVGCVLFTTAAVAVTAHFLMGMNWALACVLGAVVSPPDAVAATSIAGRLTVPRRIVTVLEGEGMVNDATALIVYRFATAAVVYGSFSLARAGLTFGLVVVGEVAWGLVVGYVSTWFRRMADDDKVAVTVSLLTPFAAYWPAEHLGGSGVIATVAAGLWVSWNAPKLISSTSRLQGWFFWDLMIFLVEGLLFLLTGLQFRDVLKSDFSQYSGWQLGGYAGALCVVIVLVRFLWVFPGTYLPRLIPAIGRKDPHPPWQYPTVVAFAGMRGGISLAAALGLPLELSKGGAFPDRDLIIFLTFCVILVTLVGQGLTLPLLIRATGVDRRGKTESGEERERELEARLDLVHTSTDRLRKLASEKSLAQDMVDQLIARREGRMQHLRRYKDDQTEQAHQLEQIEMQLLQSERDRLNDLFHDGKITDSTRRAIEHELDLQEAKLRRE